jgi:hypothetical protein
MADMSSNSPGLTPFEPDAFGDETGFEDEAKTAVMPRTLTTLYDLIHQFRNVEASTTPRSPQNRAAVRVCALLERAADEAEALGPLLGARLREQPI